MTRELFDLRKDPAERNNVIISNPEIVQIQMKQLKDWQQSVLESLTDGDYR
ncbi:MAG: hypothetical protein O2887_11785 [Bacteroidetes bacterium]|nr:hypothetical protein [Bacteroidota bacterium]MDA1121152.1 hypothetical protein [Bacteroidota bacterium]